MNEMVAIEAREIDGVFVPAEEFTLHAQDAPAASKHIPRENIDELVALRLRAKDEAANFSEAIKIQAEKYQLNRGALRRYVAALADDKTSELDAEAEDNARLLLANESRRETDQDCS